MKSVIRIDESSAQEAITEVEHTIPKKDVFNASASDGAIKLDVYEKCQLMNQDVRNIQELYQQLLKQHTEIAKETVDTMIDTDISLSKYITSERPIR